MARPNFYTPAEISAHNCAEDIWLSFLGITVNLTPLAEKFKGDPLLHPLLMSAGKDISHWFDRNTGEIRRHIDPVTGLEVPYTPLGRFIHIAPPCPRADWATDFGKPWWKDDAYVVGRRTARTRRVHIVNMLADQRHTIEVCSEELLSEIKTRYARINSHADSYTWKFDGRVLDMGKTLEENGIADEAPEFAELSLDETLSIPELHVYFNDDLTEH
eukprot:m.229161 g.229161  ORF g.229161 m.229161 type:complete len:216 (+) comp17678_c0_seq1:118-765(+)